MRDASEPAVSGAAIHLLDASGNVLASTVTDADGNYRVSDRPAARSAVVGIEPPAGWQVTSNSTVPLGIRTPELPVKPSSDFDFAYEFDVDPSNPSLIDLDGNGSADLSPVGTPEVFDGIARLVSDERYGLNEDTTTSWPTISPTVESGYTIEVRLKVIDDPAFPEGSRGSFVLAASPDGSTANSLLNIGKQSVSWGAPTHSLGSFDNTDGFHEFRVVQLPGDSNQYFVWRDGVLLNPGGVSLASGFSFQDRPRLIFGDGGGTTYDGHVEVDYVRFTTGAWQVPETPLWPDLPVRSSRDLGFSYEFDVDATDPALIDLDGNGAADFDAVGAPVVSGGVARLVTGDQYTMAENTTTLWQTIRPTVESGYTVDVRLKVLDDAVHPENPAAGSFSLAASPAGSELNSLLNIGKSSVGWGLLDKDSLSTADNTDRFHDFRIVQQPGHANRFYVWRDGVLLNRNAKPLGSGLTSTDEPQLIVGGLDTTSYGGHVELEYVRLTAGTPLLGGAFSPTIDFGLTKPLDLGPDRGGVEGTLQSFTVASPLTLSDYAWEASNGTTTITGNSPTFEFTPADDGDYLVTLTAVDAVSSATHSDQLLLRVANAPPQPVVVVGAGRPAASGTTGTPIAVASGAPHVTVTEGTLVNLTASASDVGLEDRVTFYRWTVTNEAGEVVDSVSDILDVGEPIPGYSFTAADEGRFEVVLAVRDDEGATGSSAAVVIDATNVAPQMQLSMPDSPLPGGELTSSGSFTDPGRDLWLGEADFGDGTRRPIVFRSDKTFDIQHQYKVPGRYRVTVAVDDQDGGRDEQTFLVEVNEFVPGDEQAFQVTTVTPTGSGIEIEFSDELDPSVLNLFDAETAQLGAADLTLVGASSGPIRGSLVIDASLTKVTFVKTGGPLESDVYTVRLRSAEDGFKSAAGLLLDGNRDGVGGDGFEASFTIVSAGADLAVVSVPDFVRGPGQAVSLPADRGSGIPLTLSNTTGVRSATIRIAFDPQLLTITSATLGATMPAGSTVELDRSTAGSVLLVFSSPVDLPAGNHVLADLQASVPADDGSVHYRTQQVVDIQSVTLTDVNSDPIAATADDAVHLVTFFGDASGNGRINAADAARVARIATLVDSGLAATPLTDPRIAADLSGNGRVNAFDASLLARFAILFDVPQIPPIPLVLANSGTAYLPPEVLEPGEVDQAVKRGGPLRSDRGPVDLSDSHRDGVPAAVDRAIAEWDDSSLAADDTEHLPLSLEEAIAELWHHRSATSRGA